MVVSAEAGAGAALLETTHARRYGPKTNLCVFGEHCVVLGLCVWSVCVPLWGVPCSLE
jgi:hypothetical protein